MKEKKTLCKSLLILLPLLITSCNVLPISNNGKSSQNEEVSSIIEEESSKKDESSGPHTHVFGAWEETTPAGCLDDGEKTRVCTICNYEETEVVPALGHYFVQNENKDTLAATCTEQGAEYEICVRCAEEKVNAIPPLGHDWADSSSYLGKDDNYIAPTTSSAGQKTQVCMRCQETRIVSIPPVTVDPSTITTVPDNDMRNLQQYKFINETDLTKYKTYATGSDLSAPRGMLLRFEDVDTASKYYVQVAESEAGLATAQVRETTSKVLTFHNAKLATTYYYRAATSEAALASASIKTITSTSIAPRVVYVPDVLNFRDIGGWETTLPGYEGKKINQGLYFRCAQLDAASGSTKSCLDSAGKGLAALKELGIKCDIDMRDSYNQPNRGSGPSKASTTDWPITFVSAAVPSGSEPVRWEGGTYSGTNIAEQYVKIFNAIANCDNEPVMLHCTYGADRTGIATFFLESLLGMSEKDMTRDYLWTQFTQGRNVKLLASEGAEFPQWISKTEACEGNNFADKMENHLESFGIAHSTLEHIREIFIPGYVARA